MNKLNRCTDCRGVGRLKTFSSERVCPSCGGTGFVERRLKEPKIRIRG